jgi:hypothetical protein
MWILITFVYQVGVMDSRAVSVENIAFVTQERCMEAGKAFVNMANNKTYTAKFICAKE